MQDEVNTKVVALAIRTGTQTSKVTAQVLKAAMQKFLAEAEKAKTTQASKTYHGKQTIDQLMRQNTGLTNIEVTDQNIKSFERVAKKYNIDFALKKDKGADPPRYLVFFKAKDVDVMTAAFKEYAGIELKKKEKESVRKKLDKAVQKTKSKQRQRVKTRKKVRAQAR